MAGLISQLDERIAQTEREYDRARQKAIEAQATADTLAAELAAYRQARAAEERRQGKATTPAKTPTTQPSLVPGMTRQAIIARPGSGKTSVALATIAAAGPNGVSADDIANALQRFGLHFKRNYVFNITSRLKQKELIDQRGKRYYLKQTA